MKDWKRIHIWHAALSTTPIVVEACGLLAAALPQEETANGSAALGSALSCGSPAFVYTGSW